MSPKQAVADHEFAHLSETAQDLGVTPAGTPTVQRRWVNVITGGHVSGVSWGNGPAETVLLHDARRSARAWDALALVFDAPVLALDLPGHGRSNWRRDGVYSPRKLAAAAGHAIRSFAPKTQVVVGTGLGALTAIGLTVRFPDLVRGLVLLDTLPGTLPGAASRDGGRGGTGGVSRFASQAEALDWLRANDPSVSEKVHAADARHETSEEPDGSWTWRHHLGNLSPEANRHLDDETLWEQLAAVAASGAPVLVVRPGTGSRLTSAALDELDRRAPAVQLVTIGQADRVIESDHPERLAELIRTVTTEITTADTNTDTHAHAAKADAAAQDTQGTHT